MRAGSLNVMVVALGPDPGLALQVVRCLGASRGMKIHLVLADRNAIACHSRHVQSVRACPGGNTRDDWPDILRRETTRTKAHVILPVDQETIQLLDSHRHQLPGTACLASMPSMASLQLADCKYALAQLLGRLQIPHPRTIPVTGDQGFVDAVGRLSFPVLLKPTRGSSGQGIRKFSRKEELIQQVMDGKMEHHIVQEFLEGRDAGCNVLCERGRLLAYTLQRSILPPHRPYQMPAGVEFLRMTTQWLPFVN